VGLSIDGSFNQQGSGAGVILEGASGLFIEQALRFAFKVKNNQVEYKALIEGMLLAKELGARSLLVKSDSLLVNGQITGEYQAKDPQLASYLRYVMLLKATFSMFELVHVPGEQNSQVYLLSKLASSGKGSRQRSVIQETLKSPKIAEEELVEVNRVKTLGVSLKKRRRHQSMTQATLKVPKITTYGFLGYESFEVLQAGTTETWITPYQCYLVDGLLPAKPG